MAKSDKKLHIVMVPWSAFGHMIPFYQLSIFLAKKGVSISYISTPKNILRLPQIPPELSSLMQYVSFPLAEVPGLPEGAEATVDMEFDEIPYLKTAYDLLSVPIKQFLLSHSPDWVISDCISYWLADIISEGEGEETERVTPESLTSPPNWGGVKFPSTVAFRDYEAAKIHAGLHVHNASGIKDWERLTRLLKGCQAVAVRSCKEFEGEYISLYQNLIQKTVIPVGILPSEETGNNKHGPWNEAFEWLDQQSHRSVIYVGFGSEYKLTKDEVYEIAYGLELANLPFVWALRRPTWASEDSEALPPGFLTRVSRKGVVCLGWVPQLKFLAHPSIGGSLFHSGWSSVVETLQHGHNLILLPFIIDQGLVARIMVDKGLGIEVERRETGHLPERI